MIHEALRVLKEEVPQAFPGCEVHAVFENVASMKAEFRNAVSELCNTLPYRICPSDIWPGNRPRFYWTSFSLSDHDFAHCEDRDGYVKGKLLGHQCHIKEFLGKTERVSSMFTHFPTFIRSISRKSPPLLPNGRDQCSPNELLLWEASGFRLPPYHFMLKNMVYNVNSGRWNPPSAELKEKILLFRPDYTFIKKGKALKSLPDWQLRDLRESLLGNTIHCGVLATAISTPLKDWGFIDKHTAPALLAAPSRKLVGTDGSSPSLRLIRAYLSYQDHRGGAVLFESAPSRLTGRPLSEHFDAKQWKWKAVLSCAWKLDDEHINALEARALLLALRWRSRSVMRMGKRFLHLTDSKVTMGASMKHRSNARNLNYIVERSSALQLAASMTPVLAFVRSGRNPADLPSRKLLNLRPQAKHAQKRKAGASDH